MRLMQIYWLSETIKNRLRARATSMFVFPLFTQTNLQTSPASTLPLPRFPPSPSPLPPFPPASFTLFALLTLATPISHRH